MGPCGRNYSRNGQRGRGGLAWGNWGEGRAITSCTLSYMGGGTICIYLPVFSLMH